MKNNIVRQSNALTSSRSEFTALQRDIMYMIISNIKKDDDPNKVFCFTINDLSFKKGSRVRHEELDEATTPLLTKLISIPRADGGWLKTTYASSAEYKKDLGIVEIVIDPKIRPLYYDLKNNFTSFNIDIAFKLKSKYSKKMYEIINRFKDLGVKTFKINDLKKLLGVITIDEKNNEIDKYTRFAQLKKRVLDICKEEINNKTELNISYSEPIKTGRKINAITIYIDRGNFQSQLNFEDEEGKIYSILLNDLKLSKHQAVKVIKEYSVKELRSKIYEIKINWNKKGSIGGYSAKVFGV